MLCSELGRVDVGRYIEKGQRGKERKEEQRGKKRKGKREKGDIYMQTSGDMILFPSLFPTTEKYLVAHLPPTKPPDSSTLAGIHRSQIWQKKKSILSSPLLTCSGTAQAH